MEEVEKEKAEMVEDVNEEGGWRILSIGGSFRMDMIIKNLDTLH